MGKQSRARVLGDHQAMAVARNIRVSPRKLNLVAQQIRGKKVDRALNVLTFSQKRIAGVVKKTLQSAIANAENNHDLDVDDLRRGVEDASSAARTAGAMARIVSGRTVLMSTATPPARSPAATPSGPPYSAWTAASSATMEMTTSARGGGIGRRGRPVDGADARGERRRAAGGPVVEHDRYPRLAQRARPSPSPSGPYRARRPSAQS